MRRGELETTVVSTKGQVILPKAVRERRRWDAGTRLAVEDTADGVLLKSVSPFPRTRPEDVFGCLQYKGRSKTIEDMDKALTVELKHRRARGRY